MPTCKRLATLRSASNGGSGPPEITFHIGGERVLSTPMPCGTTRLQTGGRAVLLHSPDWRIADHSKATPCGANRFPAGARSLARSLSMQTGTSGPIRTDTLHALNMSPLPCWATLAWCTRSDSNAHSTGSRPVASAGWATDTWCERGDSNTH